MTPIKEAPKNADTGKGKDTPPAKPTDSGSAKQASDGAPKPTDAAPKTGTVESRPAATNVSKPSKPTAVGDD